MRGAWNVQADDAYFVWVLRHRPDYDAEFAMFEWLETLEHEGPPADVPHDRADHEISGPCGERVRMRVLPYLDGSDGGVVFIRRIEPS